MILNGYFGHRETWALLACGWVIASIIVSLIIGIMARVGKGKEGGR